MEHQQGYVYHIKEEYFKKVQDDKLMQNKEGGNLRPTFYCYRDEKTSLLWMVPLSSRVKKYRAIYERQVQKYGSSLTIVLGVYAGREEAFLLQNMFPITERYIDHIHTIEGRAVPIPDDIQRIIRQNMKRISTLHRKGRRLVYPDIDRLEQLMLAELEE